MNTITIRQWNENQFKTSNHEWTTLLNSSDADKLFLSWEWQYTWWDVFAKTNKLKLTLLAAYNEDNTLIGIAPLYVNHLKTKKIINTIQLQFIGNICRGKETMRTEYIDFITTQKDSTSIKHTFLKYIRDNIKWDEFYFTELKKESSSYSFLVKENIFPKVYTRISDEYKSYYLDTSLKFDNYISQRGKNTRLRIYNRRKILSAKGNVTLTNADANEIDKCFILLNTLHKKRWGKDVFTDKRLVFNTKVAIEMAKRNAVKFSVLFLDESPVSIQFNYNVNLHEYNIQAGFIENFDKKLALGYLHFGYAIESAFNDETLIYDFLAGEGKNTPYKERLTDTYHDIVQLQIIKKKSLKFLYLLKDFITKPSLQRNS